MADIAEKRLGLTRSRKVRLCSNLDTHHLVLEHAGTFLYSPRWSWSLELYEERWIDDGNEFIEKGKTVQVKALVLKGIQFKKGKLIVDAKIGVKARALATKRLKAGTWPPLYFGLTGDTGPQLKRYLKKVRCP